MSSFNEIVLSRSDKKYLKASAKGTVLIEAKRPDRLLEEKLVELNPIFEGDPYPVSGSMAGYDITERGREYLAYCKKHNSVKKAIVWVVTTILTAVIACVVGFALSA